MPNLPDRRRRCCVIARALSSWPVKPGHDASAACLMVFSAQEYGRVARLIKRQTPMAISVFLSTVSDEFRAYRDQLVHDLTRQNVAVKVQEDLKRLGGYTLDTLDAYIAECDAVVHLAGDMCGAPAGEAQQEKLLGSHPDLAERLPSLGQALRTGVKLSYTQWEAWLALYHGKQLYVATAVQAKQRGPNYNPTDDSRAAQAAHLARLREAKFYPLEFTSPDNLAKQVLASGVLDLLVRDYAQQESRGRAVAEGFIAEMAKRVAGDRALDLDGMKQAVRNAIDIYENEIAGRPADTNFEDVVNRALVRAKEQVDRGQSALARATLEKAARELEREEEEHRERFVASVTALYTQARDIALATYDGGAAVEAIIELARSIHRGNAAKIAEVLSSEAQMLFEYGRDRGSNIHLVASIALRRSLVEEANADQKGLALANLGLAIWTLGDRESGTEKLEEAVKVYQASLEKLTWERAPLDWVTTQTNLAYAFFSLGEREGGTARLEEAVVAYRVALDERTRERLPIAWALTQSYLGLALWKLGERESGTGRLKEAVAACRAALEETSFEQAPLNWADIQNSLGNALSTLGARESATMHLEEGVAAYRAALEVWTRDQAPLDWATAHNNLGTCLIALGEREMGTLRLEQAVAVFGEVLEEWTRERMPLYWATGQYNVGEALRVLGERESGTLRLEEAAKAYRAALEEQIREGTPLDWAATQTGLASVLRALGERESGTKWLEESVAMCRAALEEGLREQAPLDWAKVQTNLARALQVLGERKSQTQKLEEAVAAYRAALKEYSRRTTPLEWAMTYTNLGNALRAMAGRQGRAEMLEQAVNAYRCALEELTPERVPLQWAMSSGNQGVAMMLIADRTNDAALAENALGQIQTALQVLHDGGDEYLSTQLQSQLPKAQSIHDRLKGE
jgi:tetratricopeptide (TPR) repeat protein